MKSPANQCPQTFPPHSRIRLLTGLVATLFLVAADTAAARGLAVAGRGNYGGYGYQPYRYGYWNGYGTNFANNNTVSSSATTNTPSPQNYITTLPAGAAPVVVFGKTYYFANGNYYAPEFRLGTTVYVVAQP